MVYIGRSRKTYHLHELILFGDGEINSRREGVGIRVGIVRGVRLRDSYR